MSLLITVFVGLMQMRRRQGKEEGTRLCKEMVVCLVAAIKYGKIWWKKNFSWRLSEVLFLGTVIYFEVGEATTYKLFMGF